MSPNNSNNKIRNTKRNVISIDLKMSIINRFKHGENVSQIARSLGMPYSTISSILYDRERIVNYINENSPSSSTCVITMKRGPIFDELERQLFVWIKEQPELVHQSTVQEKARTVFQDLLSKYPNEKDTNFVASSGWYSRFKKRYNLQNSKNDCTDIPYPMNINSDEIKEFSAIFKIIIESNGYRPEQVFNVSEMMLFWKRINNQSGFKFARDRLTLMLGGNISGDFKLKPLAVYHSANPQALRNIPKSSLPILWTHDAKTCVTAEILEEWFVGYFILTIKQYCKEKAIPFQALLLLSNASVHSSTLNDIDPNVKVVVMPQSIATQIQPMDQGILTLFKRYYLRRTYLQALDATACAEGLTISEFWHKFNLYNVILNIHAAWLELSNNAMNGAWSKLCPQYVHNFKGFDKLINEISKELATISDDLGMHLKLNDINKLLECFDEPVDNEVLTEHEDHVLDPEIRQFNVKNMQQGFYYLSKCLSIFEEQDPNAERFATVMNGVHELFLPYRAILSNKRSHAMQMSSDSVENSASLDTSTNEAISDVKRARSSTWFSTMLDLVLLSSSTEKTEDT